MGYIRITKPDGTEIVLGDDFDYVIEQNRKALRAVVELHKPQEITLPNGEWGTNCVECDGYFYPCPTIQAIERELN